LSLPLTYSRAQSSSSLLLREHAFIVLVKLTRGDPYHVLLRLCRPKIESYERSREVGRTLLEAFRTVLMALYPRRSLRSG